MFIVCVGEESKNETILLIFFNNIKFYANSLVNLSLNVYNISELPFCTLIFFFPEKIEDLFNFTYR